jgi:mannose-6-phosphate isomerase-like protein (cupin superfamily)
MDNEGFYVLKGKFAFPYRNSEIHTGKGQFVYAQRGKLHTYRNIGDDVGKLLVVITPADFENFLMRLAFL